MIYTLTLNPAADRELTVERIEFDSVLRATEARVDFGGKGFNVSRLLRRLDTPSKAVGFLGGKSGEILQDGLHALGVETDFVWVAGETRTNVSIVTAAGGPYIKVNEKGPVIEPASQQALLDKIEGLARPGDWWVLAGSLPPGVPQAFYGQIIQALNRHDAACLPAGHQRRIAAAGVPGATVPGEAQPERSARPDGASDGNSAGDSRRGRRNPQAGRAECDHLAGQGRGAAAHHI